MKNEIALIILFFIIVVVLTTILSVYNGNKNKLISKEIENNRNQPVGLINKQLKGKVHNCILYPTSYGYKCCDKDSKCYKIYVKN